MSADGPKLARLMESESEYNAEKYPMIFVDTFKHFIESDLPENSLKGEFMVSSYFKEYDTDQNMIFLTTFSERIEYELIDELMTLP